MALLHNERWRELAGDFEAAEHLAAAYEVTKTTNPRAATEIRDAIQYLHPATLDPKAREEYQARKAGSFQDSTPSQGGSSQGPGGTFTAADVQAMVTQAVQQALAAQQQGAQPGVSTPSQQGV